MFYIFGNPADLYWWSVPPIIFSGALCALNCAMYLNMGLQGLVKALDVPPSQLMLVVGPCTQVWHNLIGYALLGQFQLILRRFGRSLSV